MAMRGLGTQVGRIMKRESICYWQWRTYQHVKPIDQNKILKKINLRMNKKLEKFKTKEKGLNAWQAGEPMFKASGNPSKRDAKMQTRRQRQLSVIIHEQLAELFSSGELDDILRGQLVEIEYVNLAPDMSNATVGWKASGIESDDNVIQESLTRNAGRIRSMTSSLSVMGGGVPHIFFVKDLIHSRELEIEEKLSKADFGPDYIPTRPDINLKSDLRLVVPNVQTLKTTEGQTDDRDSDMVEFVSEEDLDVQNSQHSDVRVTPSNHNVTLKDVYGVDRDAMLDQMHRVMFKERRTTTSIFDFKEDEYDSAEFSKKRLQKVLAPRKSTRGSRRLRMEAEVQEKVFNKEKDDYW